MRTGFLALVLCFCCGPACIAQVVDDDWADAMFDHKTHNFGVVARGAKVEHRFTFENIYLEDMRIASVKSSCNCTTVQFGKEPIKTYEKGEVVATIDTRNFLGQREATLRVNFAPPFSAEVQLHVYCYIRSDVVFEPGEIQFGSVEQGTEVRRLVTVSYAGRSDWEILDVLSSWPHVTANVTEISRSVGQVVYQLAVTLNDDAPAGYVRDHLVLVTNDHNPKARRVLVAVEGTITPAVSVAPSPLSLGVLQTGQTVTRNLVVRGKSPFHVLGVDGPDDRFSFAVPEAAAPLQLVPVTFTAGETPGKVDALIHIRTDLAGNPSLDVKVDGMVLAGGDDSPAAESPKVDASATPGPEVDPAWHRSAD